MWLRIPTSHSSPATEDSTSPSDALCQRLAVSVSWRGKLLRPQSWRLAWKTEGWRRRLSGLTLLPSQADSSVAAWLDSSVGFPAKTSALPADRPESRESAADSSSTSSDSFASWSRSSGCFLRTSRQFSIFQQEQPFLENLPRSGSMRNGELYERPMLAARTGESGRLCWPTARAQDSKHGEATNYEMSREEGLDLLHVKVERMMRTNWHTPSTEDHKSDGPNAQGRYATEKMKTSDQRLRNQVWNWPSPRSEDSESCGNHPGSVDSLTGAARMWRTPAATEEQNDRMSTDAMLRSLQNPTWQVALADQARMWMTPNLPLGGRKNTAEQVQAKGKTDSGKRQISLEGQTMHWTNYQTPLPYVGINPNYQTRLPNETSNEYWERMTAYETENGINPAEGGMHWPTPATREYRSPNAASHMDRSTGAKHLDQLPNFIKHSFLPVPPTSTHGGKSPSGSTRRLNPEFVDWLMGLIPGWTDYAPLETASYLSKVRSLLRSYSGGHAK